MQIARRFSQLPINGSAKKLSYELQHNVIMFEKRLIQPKLLFWGGHDLGKLQNFHKSAPPKVDILSEMQESCPNFHHGRDIQSTYHAENQGNPEQGWDVSLFPPFPMFPSLKFGNALKMGAHWKISLPSSRERSSSVHPTLALYCDVSKAKEGWDVRRLTSGRPPGISPKVRSGRWQHINPSHNTLIISLSLTQSLMKKLLMKLTSMSTPKSSLQSR